MNPLTSKLIKFGLLTEDLDYHLLRASMVIIFLSFGYQKWFEYEARVLIPFIGNGPLIFWMYPVFGVRGASWFLGVSEWLICALLFLGFWNKKLGILGGPWLMRHLRIDRQYYPIHAEWLGSVCRVSGHGGECSFSDEGCGSPCCVGLSAAAGCDESIAFRRERG
jgi:Protein of unknown function, DUF417